ncbi:MAG: DUF4395 domain-containing protein [Gammaproteobacteria bacterium]|nr:DUF4395 domain-containing protein [Gammaproteobacteria bacterium]
MLTALKTLWFRDPKESPLYINDVAVRIRAGMLLIIPLFMGLTLFNVAYTSKWVVDGNTASDTYETNWDGDIIYAVEASKRTYEYSTQTIVLFYALFEMLAGMFRLTARLSPTILLASLLAKNSPPVWKPLLPKRFAWSIGACLISICLVFFNPDTFAQWVNFLSTSPLLPTTENYMPANTGTTLVWVCLGFMWLEAILGFCVGCKLHALLVWMGVLKEECEACNNIDWQKIAENQQKKTR